ncbi:sortase [Streptomyces sp. NPDC046261]|uniref:sortase domain-containing protein n=1 Tax=Streptomyces sp. NPDC046261 TaxID=3157200 RepID=UPI0033DB2559
MSRRTRLSVTALLLAVPVFLLAACAPGGGTDKVIGGPARAEEPSRVSIPSIGVSSQLIRLGRNADDSVQVPPLEKGMTAGWYTGSAKPGTPGAAVIIGHERIPDGKAVFHDLRKVTRGTEIDVERGDGKVLRFSVTDTETADPSAFPTRKVYGQTDSTALRLVTCAGDDPDPRGHPVENLIVYAELVAR